MPPLYQTVKPRPGTAPPDGDVPSPLAKEGIGKRAGAPSGAHAPSKVSAKGLDTKAMAQRAALAGRTPPRVFIQGHGLTWPDSRRRPVVDAIRKALTRPREITDAELAVLLAECPASITVHPQREQSRETP
ncbi:MAG: hypothetical protein AAF170_18210 [Bacteroidota bacterium]